MCVCLCCNSFPLGAIFLKLPVSIIQGTNFSCMKPFRDAVHMKHVRTFAPSYSAILVDIWYLLDRLTLYALVHDVIATNRTIVHWYIVGPQSDRCPLSHPETLKTLARWGCRAVHMMTTWSWAACNLGIVRSFGWLTFLVEFQHFCIHVYEM